MLIHHHHFEERLKYNPDFNGLERSDSPRFKCLLFGEVMKMFFALLMLVFGVWLGWEWAHSTVATECERQGSFYVGKKTFKCSEITEHE